MRKFVRSWTAETPISRQGTEKSTRGHNLVCVNKLDVIEARDLGSTAAVKNDCTATFFAYCLPSSGRIGQYVTDQGRVPDLVD